MNMVRAPHPCKKRKGGAASLGVEAQSGWEKDGPARGTDGTSPILLASDRAVTLWKHETLAGWPILFPTTLGLYSERGCPTPAFFARVGSTNHVHRSQRAFRQVCRMSSCPDV